MDEDRKPLPQSKLIATLVAQREKLKIENYDEHLSADGSKQLVDKLNDLYWFMKSENQNLLKTNEWLEAEKARLEELLNQQVSKNDVLLDTFKTDLNKVNGEKSALEDSIVKLKAKNAELEEIVQSKDLTVDQFKNEAKDSTAELKRLRDENQALQNDFAILEEKSIVFAHFIKSKSEHVTRFNRISKTVKRGLSDGIRCDELDSTEAYSKKFVESDLRTKDYPQLVKQIQSNTRYLSLSIQRADQDESQADGEIAKAN